MSLDESTTWDYWRAHIIGALSSMEDGDVVLVNAGPAAVDDDGDQDFARYIQFCMFADGMAIRCEVVSNTFLPTELHHTIEDLVRMRMAGWTMPIDIQTETGDSGSPNIFMDVPVADIDLAADAAIDVLWDVWKLCPDDIFTGADLTSS